MIAYWYDKGSATVRHNWYNKSFSKLIVTYLRLLHIAIAIATVKAGCSKYYRYPLNFCFVIVCSWLHDLIAYIAMQILGLICTCSLFKSLALAD